MDKNEMNVTDKHEKELYKIRSMVPPTEMLAGLAEECSELAQTALKLRRVLDGTNPTPKKEEEAIDDLYEEIADVRLYMEVLDINWKYVWEIVEKKRNRWVKCLEEAQKAKRSEVEEEKNDTPCDHEPCEKCAKRGKHEKQDEEEERPSLIDEVFEPFFQFMDMFSEMMKE